MRNPMLIAAAIAASAVTPAVAQDQVGRYTVTMQVTGSETILLDSVTGETWRLTRVMNREGEPIMWAAVPRSDKLYTSEPQTPPPPKTP